MIYIKTIKASELGTNCWLINRHVGACYKCSRYRRCKYPERITDPLYEVALYEYNRAKRILESVKTRGYNRALKKAKAK